MANERFADQNAEQIAHWNGPAGGRWVEQQAQQDVVLAPVTEALFERARVVAGERAIDVGCGCGATTIELARRVGAAGDVLAIDVSEPMLARARELAPPGLPIRFERADATIHRFEAARADLLLSRFGVMFFADPVRSFANLRLALRPGGRMVFAAWREPRTNPWAMLPLQAATLHVPKLPQLGPEDPGPFSFASEARVHRLLGEAGFTTIGLESVDLMLDLAIGGGLEAAMRTVTRIGPASRAMEGQPEAQRAAAIEAIRAVLAPRVAGDKVELPGGIWIVTARR